MANKRTGLAPWSLSREAGIESATVDGTIDVPQILQPVIETGFVDEKGNWKGIKSSEEQFHSFGLDVGIPNTGTITAPQIASGTIWPLDMTGFNDLFLAIKPTNAGAYLIHAIMGPNDLSFANLAPVNAGATLRGNRAGAQVISDELIDSSEDLTADVWNIYSIRGNCSNQKLLQFKITNNSGGESDIETAFLRLV